MIMHFTMNPSYWAFDTLDWNQCQITRLRFSLHSTGNLLRLCAFSYLAHRRLGLVKHIDNVVAVLFSPPILSGERLGLHDDINLPVTRPYLAT
jgi:hypothetical protein